jgi:hypothetical protein
MEIMNLARSEEEGIKNEALLLRAVWKENKCKSQHKTTYDLRNLHKN